jgi:hypothetical protein
MNSSMQRETFVDAVKEYRGMGDSWPKAIQSTIEFRSRIGWPVVKLGEAISKVGRRIVGSC